MALNGTMVKIDTVTVGAGGTASVTFNVPATYDDLYMVFSLRNTADINTVGLTINGVSTNQTARRIIGTGSAVTSSTYAEIQNTPSSATASTFGSGSIYITNYRSSNTKSLVVEAVSENNATLAYQTIETWLWNSSSAITSVGFTGISGGSIAQFSTVTLYGITRVPTSAKATGGMVYADSNYWYHIFPASQTFTPTSNLTIDAVVIAGGGGGAGDGTDGGGGGGAGGYRTFSGSVTANTDYAITIGAGGGSAANGSNTTAFGVTSTGGGAGGTFNSNGAAGGSGGGGGRGAGATTGGAASPVTSPVQGYAGGNGGGSCMSAGGGGGAGGVGQNNCSDCSVAPAGTCSQGGIGSNAHATWWSAIAPMMGGASGWVAATSTGYIAGGGGGMHGAGTFPVSGGLGGGGSSLGGSVFTAGATNTGSGGYAGKFSIGATAGGSGLVVVRYAK